MDRYYKRNDFIDKKKNKVIIDKIIITLFCYAQIK